MRSSGSKLPDNAEIAGTALRLFAAYLSVFVLVQGNATRALELRHRRFGRRCISGQNIFRDRLAWWHKDRLVWIQPNLPAAA